MIPPEYTLLHLRGEQLKPGPGVLYATFNGDDNQASINNPDIFNPSRQRFHIVKVGNDYSFGYKEGGTTSYLAQKGGNVIFTKTLFLWTITYKESYEAYISSGNKYISFNKFGLKMVDSKFAWELIPARPPSKDPQ